MKLFTQNIDGLLEDFTPSVKLACFADEGSEDAGDSDDTSTEEGESEEEGGDDEDTDESSASQGKKGQVIPKKRFDQVNSALREFKALGLSPADIRKAVNGYNSLLSNLNEQGEQTKTGSGRPASKITGEKRERILADLEEVIPGISKIGEVIERLGGVEQHATTTGEAARRQVLSDAISRIPELLGENRFDISDKGFVKQIEVQISNAIRSDPAALQRLLSGDLSIVDEVFGHFNKNLFSKYMGSKKVAPKRDLPALMREAEGQSSGGKGKKEPVGEREKASAAKREEDKAFFDLYHDIAGNK